MILNISEHTFELLPDRAVHWHDENTLIISDLHLGKSGHFRKSGIAAPQLINQTNIRRLVSVINRIEPDRLLILGDLFHSDVNREWFQFEEWRAGHNQLDIVLVAGNHDSLHRSFYDRANLSVCHQLKQEAFRFIHDLPDDSVTGGEFTFSGHIHPGIVIRGKGRQSVRLACFYKKARQIILPAFGEFTGLYILPDKEAESIYPIAEQRVFQLNHA